MPRPQFREGNRSKDGSSLSPFYEWRPIQSPDSIERSFLPRGDELYSRSKTSHKHYLSLAANKFPPRVSRAFWAVYKPVSASKIRLCNALTGFNVYFR